MSRELEKPIPIEIKNDPCHHVREFIEHFDNRPTLDNLRLIERYCNQELHLLLKFGVGDGVELLASLQWDEGNGAESTSQINSDLSSGMTGLDELSQHHFLTWRHASSAIRRTGSEKQAVLVDVVKFMEMPERVVPAFVWFDRIDSVNRILPHALYFSTKSLSHVFIGSVRNREACLRTDLVPSNLDKMTGQVIKRTPEVLQNIASQETNVNRNVGDAVAIVRALSCCQIVLRSDGILWGVAAGEFGFQEPIQFHDLLIGPFGFCG